MSQRLSVLFKQQQQKWQKSVDAWGLEPLQGCQILGCKY